MFAVQRQTAKSRERESGKRSPERAYASTRPALAAQRASCACGGGCPRCQEKYPLQAKLDVSQPGDALEQEADRVAEQVLRMPQPEHPDTAEARENPGLRLSRYSSSTSVQSSPEVPPVVDEVLASPGQPLDPGTRAFMEPRFGRDFSKVRVHSGSTAERSARAVNALAYTVGERIVFAEPRYSPQTSEGKRLLAHELTHTIQQNRGQRSAVKRNGDPHLTGHEAADDAAPITNNVTTDVNVQSPLQIARDEGPAKKTDGGTVAPTETSAPQKSYWFQEKPPEKKMKTEIGEIEPKGQVVIHARTFTIQSKKSGVAVTVRFAGMDSDFRDAEPREDMARAEKLVLEAIKNVIDDLLAFPEIKVEWGGDVTEKAAKKKGQVQRSHDETVRARLKEAFRDLGNRTLNIFIATDLTVAEKMSLAPLTLKTEQIYVSPNEFGDPSKLQAAIRIPLVALLGGEVGLMPGGEHGMERKTATALTEEQSKEALLHEIVHVFLSNRGASASRIWESVGSNMVKGPQAPREACENVMRRYFRAQEELFVYTQVGELYSEFSKNKSAYEAFIQAVDLFLASISVKVDQTKTVKLNVKEKVDKSKVDWEISFKYAKSVAVAEAQLDQLKELAALDIGS